MLISTKYRNDGSLIINQAFKRQGLRYKLVVKRSDKTGQLIKTDKNSRFSTIALSEIAQIGETIFGKLPDPTKVSLVYKNPGVCFMGASQANSEVTEQAAIIFNHLSSPYKVGVSKNPAMLVNVPTREVTSLKAPLPAATPKGSVSGAPSVAQSIPSSAASTPRSVASQASSVESLPLPPLPAFEALDQVKLTLDDGRKVTYTELANYSFKRRKTDQDDLWEVYCRYEASQTESDDIDDQAMTDWIFHLITTAEDYFTQLGVPNPDVSAQNLVYDHIAIDV